MRDVDVNWEVQSQVVVNGRNANHYRVIVQGIANGINVPLAGPFTARFASVPPGDYTGVVNLVDNNNALIGTAAAFAFSVPDDVSDNAPIPVNAVAVVNPAA